MFVIIKDPVTIPAGVEFQNKSDTVITVDGIAVFPLQIVKIVKTAIATAKEEALAWYGEV